MLRAVAAAAALAHAAPARAQSLLSVSTASARTRQAVNAETPPNSPPAVKSGDLDTSAVGPGYTLIPLPAFTFNPNEGAWIGALTPIFRANEKGEVEDIFVPLYLHNHLIGETFELDYFGYRHETTSVQATVSHATRIEHDYELDYQNLAASDGRYIVGLQASSSKSAFNRFFGFGNRTSSGQETNYALSDTTFKASGGVNLTKAAALIATERFRGVSVEDGAVGSLPQTLDAYPDVPGIDGADVVGQGVTLSYDTRDNSNTPLKGTWATLMAEFDQNIKFSERNRWWRLTAEGRHYWLHGGGRAVLVTHALADAVVGQDENSAQEDVIEQDTGQVDDLGNPILQQIVSRRLIRRGVPFYERPTLGGETTLRGFGRGRYVSDTAWLVNIEERVNVFSRSVMGTVVELEAAPFVDVGRVARSFASGGGVRYAQVNPGIGLHVLARPNIAGRLDIGWGRDGTSVFVGLNYPF